MLARVRLVRKLSRLAGLFDDAQPVAQPLNCGAGDKNCAFEGISALAVELIGNGGEEPVFGRDRRIAGIQQREAPGAVGRLHHARRKAGLADGCRLLVTGYSADRNRAAQDR